MPLILGESKIPALLVAYLAYRRADADHPTPSAELLTLVAGPVKDVARTHASLEVWCPSFSLVNRRDAEVHEVMLDLHADPDTTQATEDGWVAAIRRALSGGPLPGGAGSETVNPFFVWLATLSEGNREGWKIDSFTLTGGQNLITDERRIIRRTTAQCSFRSHTHTV